MWKSCGWIVDKLLNSRQAKKLSVISCVDPRRELVDARFVRRFA
jgi:hypothetical protein